MDKIRNEGRRGTTQVGEIAKTVQEFRKRDYSGMGMWWEGAFRRKEGDRNESTREKEERKA